MEKFGFFTVLLMVVAAPVLMWFTADFARRSLGITDALPGYMVLTVICHLWAVQFALSEITGVFWKVQSEKYHFFRAMPMALAGGIFGTFWLGYYFIRAYVWWMPIGLAVFGLVQLSLVGMMIGSSLLQGQKEGGSHSIKYLNGLQLV